MLRLLQKPVNRKVATGALLFVVVVTGLALLWPGQAAAQNIFNLGDPVEIIANVLIEIVGWLGKLMVQLVNIMVAVAQYNDFSNSAAIEKGWVIIRDVGNIFFIIVLLVIAFATILKIENYRYNRLLGKLIIMAVLVNFSRMIAGVFIDAMQILMLTFVSAFQNAAAGNIASALGLTELLRLRNETADVSSGQLMTALILANVLLIISIVVIGIIIIVLVGRVVALWLLVVLSPAAYVARIFPSTEKYSQMWWRNFGKYAMSGPILAFFLWLTFTIMAVGSSGSEANLYGFEKVNNAEQEQSVEIEGLPGSLSSTISAASSSERILSFIIAIALLMGSLTVTSQLGVAGGSFAAKASERIRGYGGRAAALLAGGIAGGGVGAALVAARKPITAATKGGAKRLGGLAYRKTFLEGKRFMQPLSKEFWQGSARRGQRLREEAGARVSGRGEEFMEGIPVFGKDKEAVMPREEQARRSVVVKTKSDLQASMGAGADAKEKMVQFAKKAHRTGGVEGENMREALLELATEKGNLDDVYMAFVQDGLINKDNAETEWGFKDWDESKKFSYKSIRKFNMGYLGLDKKYDPDQDDNAFENAKNSGVDDQNRLRALHSVGMVARRVGHWEQIHGNLDTESGKYHIMNDDQAADEIFGEMGKMGTRAHLQSMAPHPVRMRTFNDETNEWEVNTDPEVMDDWTTQFWEKAFTGTMIRDAHQLQKRIAGNLIGHGREVGENNAIFDDYGQFVGKDKDEQEKNAMRYFKFRELNPMWADASYRLAFSGDARNTKMPVPIKKGEEQNPDAVGDWEGHASSVDIPEHEQRDADNLYIPTRDMGDDKVEAVASYYKRMKLHDDVEEGAAGEARASAGLSAEEIKQQNITRAAIANAGGATRFYSSPEYVNNMDKYVDKGMYEDREKTAELLAQQQDMGRITGIDSSKNKAKNGQTPWLAANFADINNNSDLNLQGGAAILKGETKDKAISALQDKYLDQLENDRAAGENSYSDDEIMDLVEEFGETMKSTDNLRLTNKGRTHGSVRHDAKHEGFHEELDDKSEEDRQKAWDALSEQERTKATDFVKKRWHGAEDMSEAEIRDEALTEALTNETRYAEKGGLKLDRKVLDSLGVDIPSQDKKESPEVADVISKNRIRPWRVKVGKVFGAVGGAAAGVGAAPGKAGKGVMGKYNQIKQNLEDGKMTEHLAETKRTDQLAMAEATKLDEKQDEVKGLEDELAKAQSTRDSQVEKINEQIINLNQQAIELAEAGDNEKSNAAKAQADDLKASVAKVDEPADEISKRLEAAKREESLQSAEALRASQTHDVQKRAQDKYLDQAGAKVYGDETKYQTAMQDKVTKGSEEHGGTEAFIKKLQPDIAEAEKMFAAMAPGEAKVKARLDLEDLQQQMKAARDTMAKDGIGILGGKMAEGGEELKNAQQYKKDVDTHSNDEVAKNAAAISDADDEKLARLIERATQAEQAGINSGTFDTSALTDMAQEMHEIFGRIEATMTTSSLSKGGEKSVSKFNDEAIKKMQKGLQGTAHPDSSKSSPLQQHEMLRHTKILSSEIRKLREKGLKLAF